MSDIRNSFVSIGGSAIRRRLAQGVLSRLSAAGLDAESLMYVSLRLEASRVSDFPVIEKIGMDMLRIDWHKLARSNRDGSTQTA